MGIRGYFSKQKEVRQQRMYGKHWLAWRRRMMIILLCRIQKTSYVHLYTREKPLLNSSCVSLSVRLPLKVFQWNSKLGNFTKKKILPRTSKLVKFGHNFLEILHKDLSKFSFFPATQSLHKTVSPLHHTRVRWRIVMGNKFTSRHQLCNGEHLSVRYELTRYHTNAEGAVMYSVTSSAEVVVSTRWRATVWRQEITACNSSTAYSKRAVTFSQQQGLFQRDTVLRYTNTVLSCPEFCKFWTAVSLRNCIHNLQMLSSMSSNKFHFQNYSDAFNHNVSRVLQMVSSNAS